MEQAISVLIMGPSGAGKSSFIRSAAKALGSAAIAMAPGMDEANSYQELLGNPAYRFAGFDDVGFMPSLGKEGLVVNGMNDMLRWQRQVLEEVKADVAAGKPPRYALIAQDTSSAMGRLAYNATLVKTGRDTPPPAQSPDGAQFYTLLRQYQEQMYHVPRALKGYGVNWIAVSHINERETGDVANVNAGEGVKVKSIGADVPGGFRDILPSYFDSVFHAGVAQGQHYLRWKPSQRRPTKSRLGSLSEKDIIPNDWTEVLKRMTAAVEARAGA